MDKLGDTWRMVDLDDLFAIDPEVTPVAGAHRFPLLEGLSIQTSQV
ncbi:MAG TPA: hypothetical protein VK194_08525 [Candidatus Deferrimicrobium sp.]|nr:hypothetical protein [Candidatus Deferrimicrobium sp.]